MNRIALFGGTTEGRELAQRLADLPVQLVICVATAYGKELLEEELESRRPEGPEGNVFIRNGRMDAEKMKEFLQNENISLVLDATHPYAQEVTKNLKEACKSKEIDYKRVMRENESEEVMQEMCQNQQSIRVPSVAEAVHFLEGTEGNILVATGSKELEAYTKLSDYEKRCYVRVLSTREAVEKSLALGFQGAHLIAMQGPFSKEMNQALLKQVQASWFVTKESGAAGGFAEKAEAAKECGAVLVQIKRPTEEDADAVSVSEAAEWIRDSWLRRDPVPAAEKQEEMCRLSLIGIGAGSGMGMTREAWEAMKEADIIFGAGRMLEIPKMQGLPVWEAYQPEEILAVLDRNPAWKQAVVLLSGDVSFYSGARRLAERASEKGYPVRMLPGISSVAFLAARIQKELSGAECVSLHGRSCNVAAKLRSCGRVFLLVDKKETIKKLSKELNDFGMGRTRIWIGSRLSYPEERIYSGTAETFAEALPEAADLSVLYLENPNPRPQVISCGIPDEAFLRGKIPMTKQEVRSLTLSSLQLTRQSVVYDIGAGTGSVSVEAARIAEDGSVYAIERNPEGVELIRANRNRFAVPNLHIIEGEAPRVFETLREEGYLPPAPTHVFLGGSGGNLEEILDTVRKMNPEVRIVANAITPETLGAMLMYARSHDGMRADITQIQCARSRQAGKSHLMTGMNPVWIICLGRNEE